MRHTASLFLALLFALTLFAQPVLAQDEPSEPPITDEELGLDEDFGGDDFDFDMDFEDDVKEAPEGPPLPDPEELPPINMVYVPGGCYDMGDFTGRGDRDERPAHEVCVSDFYMSETEVTQELYEVVMGYNPAPGIEKGPKKPVTNVSWFRAKEFVERLNEVTGGFYRLPTEAEWEYAAREGGKTVVWSGTSNEGELGDYAWYVDNSRETTHEVGAKKPNALGIYDMSGNVWEWNSDYLDFEYYEVSAVEDPFGPDMSLWKVIRGGSFVDKPYKLRTTFRYGYVPTLLTGHIGIRLAE